MERRLQIVVDVQLLGGPATRQVLGVQIPLVEHNGVIRGHVVQIFSANIFFQLFEIFLIEFVEYDDLLLVMKHLVSGHSKVENV